MNIIVSYQIKTHTKLGPPSLLWSTLIENQNAFSLIDLFKQANIYKYYVIRNLNVEPGVKPRNFIDIIEFGNFYSFIGEN